MNSSFILVYNLQLSGELCGFELNERCHNNFHYNASISHFLAKIQRLKITNSLQIFKGLVVSQSPLLFSVLVSRRAPKKVHLFLQCPRRKHLAIIFVNWFGLTSRCP